MIRRAPWNRRTRLLAFHELTEDHDNDDGDDDDENSTAGYRHRVNTSCDHVVSLAASSFCNEGETTPILPAASVMYLQFWKLAVPILRRRNGPEHPRDRTGTVLPSPAPPVLVTMTTAPYSPQGQQLQCIMSSSPRTQQLPISCLNTDTPETIDDEDENDDEAEQEEESCNSPLSRKNPVEQTWTPLTCGSTPHPIFPATPCACAQSIADLSFSTIEPSSPDQHDIRIDGDGDRTCFEAASPRRTLEVSPVHPAPTRTESPQTIESEHSNPPHIPAVQIATLSTSTPISLWRTPLTSIHPRHSPSRIPGSVRRSPNGVLRLEPQIEHRSLGPTICCRTPGAFLPQLGKGMDEVSSLGGDSLGETPSKILLSKLAKRSGSVTLETTGESSRHAGEKRWLLRCCRCCRASLPTWLSRIPPALRYALLVAAILWIAAMILVILSLLLRDKNTRRNGAFSTSSDWTQTLTSPPSASSLTPSSSRSPTSWPTLVPTLSPTQSATPTERPTISREPASSPPPPSKSTELTPFPTLTTSITNTTTTLVVPSVAPSPEPLIRTLSPTETPALGQVTQFPTFFPTFTPRKMGMERRERSMRSNDWG